MAKVTKAPYLNPDFDEDTIWRCEGNRHIFRRRSGRDEVYDMKNHRYLNGAAIVKLESCECPSCP